MHFLRWLAVKELQVLRQQKTFFCPLKKNTLRRRETRADSVQAKTRLVYFSVGLFRKSRSANYYFWRRWTETVWSFCGAVSGSIFAVFSSETDRASSAERKIFEKVAIEKDRVYDTESAGEEHL